MPWLSEFRLSMHRDIGGPQVLEEMDVLRNIPMVTVSSRLRSLHARPPTCAASVRLKRSQTERET